MFAREEGRGGWHGRPPQSAQCQNRGGRRYRGGDEDAGPESGRGWHGGHSGHGRGPGHGGFGRGGWIAREMFFGPGRGPMVRRGDVRTAILALLAEEPMHGYQIIGQLGERSGGMWRPSAGSVYPTLQQLEDEGLVKGVESDGRTVYTLTEIGKTAAEGASKGPLPWKMPGSDEQVGVYDVFRSLAAAVAQVSQVGSPETKEKARDILIEARRSLYRLLAEDDRSESTPGE